MPIPGEKLRVRFGPLSTIIVRGPPCRAKILSEARIFGIEPTSDRGSSMSFHDGSTGFNGNDGSASEAL